MVEENAVEIECYLRKIRKIQCLLQTGEVNGVKKN